MCAIFSISLAQPLYQEVVVVTVWDGWCQKAIEAAQESNQYIGKNRICSAGSTPSGCLPPLEIGADSPDRSVSTSGSSRLLRYNESLLTAVQQSSALSSVSSSCEAQRNQASADGSSMALMPVETHGKGPKTPRPPMKSLMSYDPSLGRHASLHKHQSGLSSSGYLQQACQIKANTEGHTPNLTSRTVNIGQADSEGHTPNLSSRTVNIGQQPGEETCTSKGQDPMTLGIGLEDSRLLGRYGWTLSAQVESTSHIVRAFKYNWFTIKPYLPINWRNGSRPCWHLDVICLVQSQ